MARNIENVLKVIKQDATSYEVGDRGVASIEVHEPQTSEPILYADVVNDNGQVVRVYDIQEIMFQPGNNPSP